MKYIFILFFCINLSFANDLFTVEILKSNTNLNFENIKIQKNFTKISMPIIKNSDSNDYWLKLKLNLDKSSNKSYIISILSIFEINKIEYENTQNLQFIDKNTIEVNKHSPSTIYIKIKNKKDLIYMNMFLKEKHLYLKEKQIKDKLYGISYGIIIGSVRNFVSV